MANFACKIRSNYIIPRDPQQFRTYLEQFEGIEVVTSQKNGETLYGFTFDNENGDSSYGGIPNYISLETVDETIDFFGDLARLSSPGRS